MPWFNCTQIIIVNIISEPGIIWKSVKNLKYMLRSPRRNVNAPWVFPWKAIAEFSLGLISRLTAKKENWKKIPSRGKMWRWKFNRNQSQRKTSSTAKILWGGGLQRRIHWLSPQQHATCSMHRSNISATSEGDCPVSQVNWLSLASPAIWTPLGHLLSSFLPSLFPSFNPHFIWLSLCASDRNDKRHEIKA